MSTSDRPVHEFGASYEKGEKGEIEIALAYHDILEYVATAHGSDFVMRSTGDQFELKSDQYDMNTTKNFFIEHISNDTKQSPGGPWQALTHGSVWYAYAFVKNRIMFVFNCQDLVDYLDTIVEKYPPIEIPNGYYNTIGYKIPRKLVIDNVEGQIADWNTFNFEENQWTI
jgi:hypothetical protein